MRHPFRMSSLAAVLLAGAAAVAVAAEAPYIGLRGSYAWIDEPEVESSVTGLEAETSDSYGGAVALGWDAGNGVRIEGEVSYLTTDVDNFTFFKDLINLPSEVGNTYAAAGDISVWAPMVNAFYDLNVGNSTLKPYIGAGIGAAYVSVDAESAPLLVFIDDSDWAFAYQFMAGVSLPLDERVMLSAGYRYFATMDVTMDDSFGTPYELSIESHNFDVGLRFQL